MKIHVTPEDIVTGDVGEITTIGIDNITDLKAYRMGQVDDRVTHFMEFNNGGTCEVTYLMNGKLEVFAGKHIQVQIKPGQYIVIGQPKRESGKSRF